MGLKIIVREFIALKVLRVIYDLQVGGVQRMLLRMLPLLRKEGVDAHIVCLKEEGEMASQFTAAGIPLHLCKFRSRLDPIALWKLSRLIREHRFDIVHSHMYASNIALNAASLLERRAAVINSYHSQTPFRGDHQRRMILMSKRIPRSIVAVSKSVRKPLLDIGLGKARLRVIHNGVEIPSQVEYPEMGEAGRPIRLFWGGRFVGQKRVGMLVDIAERLDREAVPFHMTLVGAGPQFEKLKHRVKAAGLSDRVDFPGWQADIEPYIRAADLYISASDREGLPNTLLEVCAQGRGFLVADIPPNREVLGRSEAGVCIGDDPADWVAQIRHHQQNPDSIRSRGEAAYRRVKDFSVQRTCDLTMEMYREVLAR